MDADLSIAAIAALVGKRARARMLTSQMDGRAHAAKELAYSAGVTPQTASSHLAKLLRERRLALERQSRHHHFRIAVRSDRPLRSGCSGRAEVVLAPLRPQGLPRKIRFSGRLRANQLMPANSTACPIRKSRVDHRASLASGTVVLRAYTTARP